MHHWSVANWFHSIYTFSFETRHNLGRKSLEWQVKVPQTEAIRVQITDLLWCYLPPCVGKFIFATLTLARMQWVFSMQCANLRLAVCSGNFALPTEVGQCHKPQKPCRSPAGQKLPLAFRARSWYPHTHSSTRTPRPLEQSQLTPDTRPTSAACQPETLTTWPKRSEPPSRPSAI